MRYFNKLLTLILCINNVNCTEIVLNNDLNKTEIFSRKTSESFRNIYKKDSPKSSPTLYNSITISQNDTNQSTIINTVNTLQNDDIANNNQSTIININTKAIDTNIILNVNNITTQDKKNTLINQRTFNSAKDFRDYYTLYPYTPSELGLFGSLFNLWHSYWKKEVEQVNNSHFQCVEYTLSKNLLKTISYINKLVNYIRCDEKDLKYNPYVIKYINEHIVNMDLKDPRIDLFPEYYVNKHKKQCTDAITYTFYKTFRLLQYFINSLDFEGNNRKSLAKIIENNKNINKEQLNIIKNELKQQLKSYKDNFNKKNNEYKDIAKKLDCYKQYYNSNQIMLAQVQHKINKYTKIKDSSSDEIKKKEADNKLNEYNNKKAITVNQINNVESASNKYKDKFKTIEKEMQLIQIGFNKKYKKYCDIKQIITNPDSVVKTINDNLEQYFNEKEQLDNELRDIYNNKLLNPLKLNILKNSNNNTVSNIIEETSNELEFQKNNINNYVEILKDMMKQLFKIENNNK